MILKDLADKGLISPPRFILTNCHYLCMMGSVAYGVSSDTSDMDLYGFAIPPKEVLFPHLAGHVAGFDQNEGFQQYQQHHIKDESALGGKGREYDVTVYNIAKYFLLVMQNNPNMIDSLFVPENCVTHITHIGQMVRDNRNLFLHRGSWHKFRGYAWQQMAKAKTKDRGTKEIVEFEVAHNIPHSTTLETVRKEIRRRNL